MRPGENGRKVRSPRWGRGKRWQARWIDNGWEKARAFTSKDAAEAHLARIAVHGPTPPRPAVTVAEYAETWRRSQLHHRPHTVAALNTIFTRLVQPQLGRLPVAGVERADIQNAVIDWSSHYAPATVRQAYGYTKTLFAAAILDKLITESPCKRVSLPEPERRRIMPLTPDQIADVTDAMPPHLRAAVTLAAATGLRISELTGLSPAHVRAGVVTVDRQLVAARNGQPVFGPPKTPRSARDVSLGTVAASALVTHQAAYTYTSGLLFGTVRGGPLDRKRASEAWRRATRDCPELDGTGWHDLRHFHASALIAAGLSPRAVADRLGHSTVTQTLNTYAHLWPTDDAKSTAAIDAVLGGR